MGLYILTSMFESGFPDDIAELFRQRIARRKSFAFVASEFRNFEDKTDFYFKRFLNMFEEKNIRFEEAFVVDGRMTPKEAQDAVARADVVWLSGGDTLAQFKYLREYGLCGVIRRHEGVVIGMSAGSINLARTAVCTASCGHDRQQIYDALGCVDISVEPNFVRDRVSPELLDLSRKYVIYGLCDDSAIICSDKGQEFFGEMYKISDGNIERVR